MSDSEAARLMVMGTGSGVGKSVITTGLARIYKNRGWTVAPFKAQNMSNNAEVARQGGEIATSQAVQARACGLAPSVHFNPVLLKPSSDHRSEVLLQGEPWKRMKWTEYRRHHERLRRTILDSYHRLSRQHDLILLEGAGSPAEPNLRDHDLVNMPMAEDADAPVLLVGDISRGGVFAWLLGTVKMLEPRHRNRVKGVLINRFRGTRSILDEALSEIERRLDIPVVGVVPHTEDLRLPHEDSRDVDRLASRAERRDCLRVGVVRFPRIANFTDLQPLAREPDVQLETVRPSSLPSGLDLVVLPGSKNTVEDLLWMRSEGLISWLRSHVRGGGAVLGLCGGYQMMGRELIDPRNLESRHARVEGLGWLAFEVRYRTHTLTRQVTGTLPASSCTFKGYEIRYGRLHGPNTGNAWLLGPDDEPLGRRNGAVWGTSVHGLFSRRRVTRWFLNTLRKERGLAPLTIRDLPVDDPYDRWANCLRDHLDLERIDAWLRSSRRRSKEVAP